MLTKDKIESLKLFLGWHVRNIKSWGLWHGKLAMSVVDIRSYTLQLIQLVSMVDFRHLDLFNFIVFFDFCFLTNAWFTFSCFFLSERVNFGFHELGSVLRKLSVWFWLLHSSMFGFRFVWISKRLPNRVLFCLEFYLYYSNTLTLSGEMLFLLKKNKLKLFVIF